MATQHPLQLAFENIAGHIVNLEEMQGIIGKMREDNLPIPDCINLLEEKMKDAEVTLVTDIRILINELHHISRE